MTSNSMLKKTRQINKTFQKAGSRYADFKEMSETLKNVVNANTYIVTRKGEILGHALVEECKCDLMIKNVLENSCFPEEYNEYLLLSDESRVNLRQDKNECVILPKEECHFTQRVVTIIPVLGGGSRLGTLVLSRQNKQFDADDLILGEISATVVGMEILRSRKEKTEAEARHKAVVQLAVDTLSYSELEAIKHIFEKLGGSKGLLVASKIADSLGITRSVIVNALRKLESAGVIESRSLGMKGTFIKILNPYLLEHLAQKSSGYRLIS